MKNNPPYWLYRRTRILNILHSLKMAGAHSQMTADEKACLARYASNKKLALEIGTYMGVSASIIANSLSKDGTLYCIDPFEKKNNETNPKYKIAERELKRADVFSKIFFLIGYSSDENIKEQIPGKLDFIFVDGDHSYEGLENDWQIVLSKLDSKGIVCLHDTTIPERDLNRDFGSVKFFNDIIRSDKDFSLLETVYSMNILIRK